MTRRRAIAIGLLLVVIWMFVASHGLRTSLSTIAELGESAGRAEPSAPLSDAPTAAQSRADASGATPDETPVLRESISAGLKEAWGCLGEKNFRCASGIVGRLSALDDLTDFETAQLLTSEAGIQAAQNKRTVAIHILRDRVLTIPDLSDEYYGRTYGILASLYFALGRYREAIDAIDRSQEFTPEPSLSGLREQSVAALLDAPAVGPDRSSVDQRNLILLNETIE